MEAKKDESKKTLEENYHLTDLGNAQRLKKLFGSDIRFSHPYKNWIVWDGKRWNLDRTAVLEQFARETVKSIYDEGFKSTDNEKRQKLIGFALKSESSKGIRSMIELAKSEPGIPILPEDFDKDKMLFNAQNGTIDLRTGELKPHTKDSLITKISPVVFDKKAKCPIFDAFLDKIFQGNKNIIKYIQRKCGYILTGETREEEIDILYGIGGNGKSKLTDEIVFIMGDYHQKANVETIQEQAKKNGSSPSPDVACLKGARLVTVSEPGKGIHLNEQRIKDWTGRDVIKARHLHEEPFDFKPEFKLWIYTNYKPIIKGQDRGIWRRVKLVPFEVSISKEEEDKELDKKLMAESSGILNWMIQGCLEWQGDGLNVPDEILQATADYKDEMDVFSDYLKECCDIDKGAREYNLPLWNVYRAWCKLYDYDPFSIKKFAANLEERGFKRMPHDEKGISFKGLTIKNFILEGYENPKPISGMLGTDELTELTQVLVIFLKSPSRGKLPETASVPSVLSGNNAADNEKNNNSKENLRQASVSSSGNFCGICGNPFNGSPDIPGRLGEGQIHISCNSARVMKEQIEIIKSWYSDGRTPSDYDNLASALRNECWKKGVTITQDEARISLIYAFRAAPA